MRRGRRYSKLSTAHGFQERQPGAADPANHYKLAKNGFKLGWKERKSTRAGIHCSEMTIIQRGVNICALVKDDDDSIQEHTRLSYHCWDRPLSGTLWQNDHVLAAFYHSTNVEKLYGHTCQLHAHPNADELWMEKDETTLSSTWSHMRIFGHCLKPLQETCLASGKV